MCHICCDTGSRFFLVSSEGLPHLVASYDTQGECGVSILTRILTGLHVQWLLHIHKWCTLFRNVKLFC
jgi:hypothetical protein